MRIATDLQNSAGWVSVVESVSHFDADLTWIGVVPAPESLTVIQQKPAVGQIHRGHRHNELFGEGSAHGKIEGRVLLQMGGHVTRPVREARTVIQIAAHRDPLREAE